MKNWKKAGIGALCVMSLLAGCGMQDGKDDGNGGKDDSADEPQITLEQIRAANDPRSLLEKHDAVTVTVQESDQNDAVTDTAKFQYTYVVDEVLAWYHYQYTENSDAGEDEVWGEANEKMYAERRASDDAASLSIHFRHDDKQDILDMMPQCPTSGENAEQTIDGCSEEDGAILLSVTTRYLDSSGYYYTTCYRVDPATSELLEMSVTDYHEDENGAVSKQGIRLYRWSYDEPYKAGRNLLNEVLFSTDSTEDVCDLTYFYPAPGSEKGWDVGENGWSVSEMRVAHGTRILFLDSADLALYADRELTKPIDDTVSIDTNGEEMTVYVVPDAPMN